MKYVIDNVLLYPAAIIAPAAGWCVFWSLLMRLPQRLDGFSPAPSGPVLATRSARV